MWYVYDVRYAVLYVRVSCFVVRGCGVSRRYIHVCYCDMFSVVNVHLDHLKFCIGCIDGRRYVCCSECNVVSNECNEPTSYICILIYSVLHTVVISGDDVCYSVVFGTLVVCLCLMLCGPSC